MTATAASKSRRKICTVISTVTSVLLIDGPLFPSSVSSKCPAVMFAVRRTASSPGRIRLLTFSMITINGINIVCVPWGTKCSRHVVGVFDSPK